MNTQQQLFIFLTCVLFTIFSNNICNAQIEHILDVEKPKGKISKIYETSHQVSSREGEWLFNESEFLQGRIMEFNDEGKLTSLSYFSDPDRIFYTYKIGYEGNRMNSFEVYSVGLGKQLMQNGVITNNDNGLIEKLELFQSQKNEKAQTFFFFYKNKKLVRIEEEGPEKKPYKKKTFISDGHIKSISFINEGEVKEYTSDFIYADKNMLEQIISVKNKKEINKDTYTYKKDKNDNWTLRLHYKKNTDKYILKHRYILSKKEEEDRILSQSELNGYWTSWDNQNIFHIKDSNNATTYTKENGYPHKNKSFSYNSTNGDIRLEVKSFGKEIGGNAKYNGKVLTIKGRRNYVYYLTKIPIENTNQSLSDFNDKKSTVETFKEGTSYGLRKTNGLEIIPPIYEDAYPLNNEFIKVKQGGLWGVFNYEGRQITEFIYDNLSVRFFGYIETEVNRLNGLLDPEGKELFKPVEYDYIGLDENKYIYVRKNNNPMGVFDKDLNPILPVHYAFIKKDSKNTITAYNVSKRQTEWYTPNFKLITTFRGKTRPKPLDNNRFSFYDYDKGRGILDSLGNIILEGQFDGIEPTNGRLVIAENEEKYALYDVDGNKITDFEYDRILFKGYDDESISTNILMHNAAVIYLKDMDCGYLDGYGNDMPLKPSRFINFDQFYKKYEVPNLISFKHPSSWKNQKNGIFTFGKAEDYSSFTSSLKTYEGNIEDYLKNTKDGEWKKIKIKGKTAYQLKSKKTININHYQTKTIWKTHTYIPTNKSEVISLTFECDKNKYLSLSQDLFDVMYTLELKF